MFAANHLSLTRGDITRDCEIFELACKGHAAGMAMT